MMSDRITQEAAPAGTRMLMKERHYYSSVEEVTVVEWSPSGHRVKLRHPSGAETWSSEAVEHGVLVEILPSAAPGSCDEQCPMLAVVRQYANLKNWDGSYKQWIRESSGPEAAQDALIDMLIREKR